MPAAISSPIPAVLVKLGPLDADRVADLHPYLDSVPDPRSRRGRWYSLTAILLVCACAVVSGAKSIDELAEWGERAPNTLLTVIGIRRHPLRWRRTPAPTTIGRVLGAIDGEALDRAVGAYLADRHRAATEPAVTTSASGRRRVIAVDGKALKGSARLTSARRHLPSAVTHGCVVTLAQVEVGAKTNETTHFRPLLAPLDLADAVVTFDALHSVKANVSWLVEAKKAHYIAVIKTNQPTAHSQLAALPWRDIPVPANRLRLRARQAGVPLDQDLRHRGPTRRDLLSSRPPGHPCPPPAKAHRRTRDPRERLRRHQPRRPPDRPGRSGRRDPRALGSGELLAPHQGRHLRRGRLHRSHRDRTSRHGNLPQPCHRRAEDPRSREHRQDHPGDPR